MRFIDFAIAGTKTTVLVHLEEQADGSVKYKKDAFRLVIPAKDDFSHIDMWYREDRRHNPDVHYVHQLQNAHLQMTKMHLTSEPV